MRIDPKTKSFGKRNELLIFRLSVVRFKIDSNQVKSFNNGT